MKLKTAKDYFREHDRIQSELNKHELDVKSRLKFLIDKYQHDDSVIHLYDNVYFTIQGLIHVDAVNTFTTLKKIYTIRAIEKWNESKEIFVQLSMF